MNDAYRIVIRNIRAKSDVDMPVAIANSPQFSTPWIELAEKGDPIALPFKARIGTGGHALWSTELAYPENAGQYPIAV